MSAYLFAVIQGIIEGLTEFLPISSTGHMILTEQLLRERGIVLSANPEVAKTFEVFIQLGAILAVALLYRERIVAMLSDFFQGMEWKPRNPPREVLTVWHILLAMIPAVVLGLLAHKAIKTYLFSPVTVVIGLVIGGIYLIVAENVPRTVTAKNLDQVTYRQAIGIGLLQCLSLWPGFSRAGATIAGGLFLGVNHRTSADFSFLLAIPMMCAASALDLVKSAKHLSLEHAGPFAVGFLVSFIVAWLAVVGFLKFLERTRLTPFAIYRFIISLLFVAYLWR